MFWRRAIFDKVGGALDESFSFAMDWDLILRFQEAGARFVRVPRFLGAFRIHTAQKSQAVISEVGEREMAKLRTRHLGHAPGPAEINRNVRAYFVKHLFLNLAHRRGLLRS